MGHLLLNQHFSDIAQISELTRDWDLEFQQTQAGPLSAQVLQQLRPGFHFGAVEFSRCIKQEGIPPLSGRTFALLRKPGLLEWCGHAVSHHDLVAFHPTAGFASLSAPGFSVYTVTLPEAIWQQQIRYRLGWATADDFSHEHVLRASPGRVARLRCSLERYHWQLTHPEPPGDAQPVTEDDCIDALLAVIADATQHLERVGGAPASQRAHALRRACELIFARAGEPVTLADLCAAGGVSERTLQYAFREHTRQSPKTFIRSYRLDRVRHELGENVDPEPITAIAARWGFTHMGQFARYYRQQFGELPSETRHWR
jgi:AraC family transcriptional regulator, ethanolamine operon transcriptional activator